MSTMISLITYLNVENGHFLFLFGESIANLIQIFGYVGKYKVQEHLSLECE